MSRTSGLKTGGETITVSGKGYDTRKGIYVAFCKDNGPGKPPSPCGGGADKTGSTGASHWISDNPPSYGKGLARPYGSGGTFSVTVRVSAKLSGTVDCAKTTCAVVTRADHTRAADRTQDVRVPVSFDEGTPVAIWAGGAGVAAVVAVGAALLVLRRRRASGRATRSGPPAVSESAQ
ncbi:hypothetical protein OHR68_13365 [Spirillospora sp. NBC_00431]